MHELVANLHIHSVYSDGFGTHKDIAKAAIKAGLDVVIVTDHNLWVQGVEEYFEENGGRVMLLIGEEVHDQARQPQKNHLLILGANRELAAYATDPQTLIDQANQAGGLTFLAHPVDPEAPKFHQDDLSWVSWDAQGYTGIELWNAMSEFKTLLTGYPQAIKYAFNFNQVAHAPLPQTLEKWDELLSNGQPVIAIGGSDAHELPTSLGPVKRKLFPYEQHFKAINTHLLVPQPPSGDLAIDKRAFLKALTSGHAFIGYDLPASTRGFRFSAHLADQTFIMGDTFTAQDSATLQIKLPHPAECHLLKDGEVIRSSNKRGSLIHKVDSPGVYRVEAYIQFKGKRRGWIFSNPIYVR